MFLGVMDSNSNNCPSKEDVGENNGGQLEEGVTLMGNGHGKEAADTANKGDGATDSDKMPFITVLLRKRLHLLPIVTFIFIFASFIICYVMAVSYGHVERFFPYISHTGNEAPERSYFSMLVNIGAFLLGTNVYIRYKHMSEVLTILTTQHSHCNQIRKPRKLNIASLVVGLLSAFGLSMVANFQTVDMRPLHYTGAAISFFMGSAYCWLQTAISLRFRPWAKVTVMQVINSLVLSIFLVMFTISKIIYRVRLARGEGTKWDTLRPEYLVSTITEWLTALAIVSYVLTFYHDFKNAQLHTPRVSVRDKDYVLKDYKLRDLAMPETCTEMERVPPAADDSNV